MSAAPYFILVALVVLTGYLQSRQAQKRTPAANKQMAMVTKVLPIFFGLISLQFPAGLVLYFFVSNLWRLGQQEVIFRRFQSGSATTAKPAIGKGKTATAAAVIDVESRDRNGDGGDGGDGGDDGETVEEKPPRATPPARPAKTRTAPPAGAGAAGAAQPKSAQPKPAAGESRRGGGLRGLFAPPPPAEGNGASTPSGRPKPVKPAPSKSAPAPRGSSTSSTSGRPGQAGRRTSNKKRKRKR
jgi:hypothetical protein